MGLDAVVAAPFRGRGRDRMRESEFVVSLSLDRDWFSPDQASRIVDIALGRGLLSQDGDDLVAEFDPNDVDLPPDFTPNDGLLDEASPFEQVLEALVATGMDKQDAVAGINQLQADLDLTIAAAAVVYGHRHGVDVSDAAAQALRTLRGN